jgi:hypothetical protein
MRRRGFRFDQAASQGAADATAWARRRWRRSDARWLTLAVLAAVAVVLGYVGFARLDRADEQGFGDLLVRTVQLFVLESNAVEPPVPWQLEIARFLAPAVAVYAAIAAVVALFRDELRALGLRLRGRDHVVVVGLGRKGSALVRSLHLARRRVVAIERDPTNPSVAAARERGILVLTGDGSDLAVLARAQVPRARDLAILCGEDADDIEVAFSAARLPRRRPYPLNVLVHIEDVSVQRTLQAEQLTQRVWGSLRVNFFNVAQVAARLVLERHRPWPGDGRTTPHLLLAATGPLAEELILEAARAWRRQRAEQERLFVTVVADEAGRFLRRVSAIHPSLTELCELVPRDLSLSELLQGALTLDRSPTSVYVRLEREAQTLAAALALRRHPDVRAEPVVLVVDDETTGVATTLRGDAGDRSLVAFGMLREALTPELLERGAHEQIARAMHDSYLAEQLAHGDSAERNPSLVTWAELPESLKDSNRRFADAVGAKLAGSDLVVIPAPLPTEQPVSAFLSRAEVEELARAEHDRWCRDLLRDGWRPTDGDKDAGRKLHPKLVSWEELSEEDREKDRAPIRRLPAILAAAGLEIRRVGDDAGPAASRDRDPAQ